MLPNALIDVRVRLLGPSHGHRTPLLLPTAILWFGLVIPQTLSHNDTFTKASSPYQTDPTLCLRPPRPFWPSCACRKSDNRDWSR